MLLQIIGFVCFIGFILSVIGILWGKPMHLKGAEVPADWRAAISFLTAALVIGGIFYLLEKKKKK
jgi:hypothetical protein